MIDRFMISQDLWYSRDVDGKEYSSGNDDNENGRDASDTNTSTKKEKGSFQRANAHQGNKINVQDVAAAMRWIEISGR